MQRTETGLAGPLPVRRAAAPLVLRLWTLTARVLVVLALWQQRARERHQLANLGEHMLRDLGLQSDKVEAECAKPFWRA